MREILFRGKRSDNGEWIYGSLIKRHIGSFIVDEDNECALRSIAEYDFAYDCKLVATDTTGQYTGLTDKNGKKIFEGDIVKFCDIKGVINYSMGCYCVKTNKPDWKSRNNPAIDIVLNEYENELEVIGNIHDNPELLKEGAEE